MLQKIVKTASDYPDVLIYVTKSDEGEPLVIIHAFGTIKEENQDDCENMTIEKQISFETFAMADSFIVDYSIESANRLCQENNIYFK